MTALLNLKYRIGIDDVLAQQVGQHLPVGASDFDHFSCRFYS